MRKLSAAVQQDGWALQYASDEMKNDRVVVLGSGAADVSH